MRWLLLALALALTGCATSTFSPTRGDSLARAVLHSPTARILDTKAMKTISTYDAATFARYLEESEKAGDAPTYFLTGDFNKNGKRDAVFFAITDEVPTRDTVVSFVLVEEADPFKLEFLQPLKNLKAVTVGASEVGLQYSWCYWCDGVGLIEWKGGKYVFRSAL